MHWDIPGLPSEKFGKPELPSDFFGDFGFPSVILVNKTLKVLCLSFKMVYQHLLYLLSFLLIDF